MKDSGGKRPINEGKRKRVDSRHTRAAREKHLMTMMTTPQEWDSKKYDSLEKRILPPVGSGKREFLVRPFQEAAHDLATLKLYPPRGPACGHLHCHSHVPFGPRAHHLAKAANLCKKCYNQVKNPRTFPKFPHCEVAFPHQDVCCEGCFVMCKCGEQMARRCGKLQKMCKRQDGDFSDCRAPGPPK